MHSFWKYIVFVLMILGWAAPASAVPVDLLKPIAFSDVACDAIVDETVMLSSVQQWIKEYNAELSALGAKGEKQIIRSLLDMNENKLSALQSSNTKEEIAELAEYVLERWDQTQAKKEKLDPFDQKVLTLLDNVGLIPAREEGMAFLRLNYAYFYKHIHFSPEGKAFVDVLVTQPLCQEEISSEDFVYWTQADMADWAVQWEKFLRANPKNPYAPEALKRYHAIINLMLFQNLPPRDQNGAMDQWDWWKDEMDSIVKTHQGTLAGRLLEEFIVSVDANGQKEPKDLKQRFAALIDTEFVPEKQAA